MQSGYTGTKLNMQYLLHAGSMQYRALVNCYKQSEPVILWSCCHCNSGLGFNSPYQPSLNNQPTTLEVPFGSVS